MVGGAAADATARSGAARTIAALRAACWLRVALRRASFCRRGMLATATLAAVTVAAPCSRRGSMEPASLSPVGVWLAIVGAAWAGASSGTCWRTMNKAMAASEAANAPPPHLARLPRPREDAGPGGCPCRTSAAMAAAMPSAKPAGAGARAWPRSTSPQSCQRSRQPAQFGVVFHAPQQETRLVGGQVAVHQRGQLLEIVIVDLVGSHVRARSRVALWVSTKGRSSTSMASRARKMRERTVPIGQSIFCAISS